jgi:hypothetical protein
MRKGKKENIEGLSLPAGKNVAKDKLTRPEIRFPAEPPRLFQGGFGGGLSTSVSRINSQFTVTQIDGAATFTLEGRIDSRKARLRRVTKAEGQARRRSTRWFRCWLSIATGSENSCGWPKANRRLAIAEIDGPADFE